MNAVEKQAMWQDACAAALAGLPGMGPVRLSALFNDRSPDSAWQGLAQGESMPQALLAALTGRTDLLKKWRTLAKRIDPLEVLERYQQHDISVWHRYGRYPSRLRIDEYAPSVLFYQGDPTALSAPTVSVIGTRHCTLEGRALARTFGEELADAGISVVSGLALGIDGAAHTGALHAAFGVAPVGVVGSGLDVPYPKRHRHLWDGVREKGLLISESPLGATPEPWRFPARNRIIAGLADAVLVVESHSAGGSLLTVNEAIDRGVPVMAVPGSIWSPASSGSNKLIADGAAPACSTQDVLDALPPPLAREVSEAVESRVGQVRNEGPSLEVLPSELPVLDAIGFSSTSTDEILLRTCLPLGEVAVALTRLQAIGLISGEEGWWYRPQRSEASE